MLTGVTWRRHHLHSCGDGLWCGERPCCNAELCSWAHFTLPDCSLSNGNNFDGVVKQRFYLLHSGEMVMVCYAHIVVYICAWICLGTWGCTCFKVYIFYFICLLTSLILIEKWKHQETIPFSVIWYWKLCEAFPIKSPLPTSIFIRFKSRHVTYQLGIMCCCFSNSVFKICIQVSVACHVHLLQLVS